MPAVDSLKVPLFCVSRCFCFCLEGLYYETEGNLWFRNVNFDVLSPIIPTYLDCLSHTHSHTHTHTHTHTHAHTHTLTLTHTHTRTHTHTHTRTHTHTHTVGNISTSSQFKCVCDGSQAPLHSLWHMPYTGSQPAQTQ